jgi:hypothetical protein
MGKTSSICILGTGRTGSTHLGRILNNFEKFAAFGELFGRRASWGLVRHVPAFLVVPGARNNNKDPAIVAFAHANPRLFLDRVARICRWTGKPVMAFQLFPHHLPEKTIETEILERRGTRAMLITRRAIDTYISQQKAYLVSKWTGTDTTEQKVAIDAGHFADWHSKIASWYIHWEVYHRARGLELPVIRYEADIVGGVAHTLERFKILAAEIGIDLELRPVIKITGLKRQDRTEEVRDKVANWTEFEKGLSQRGLDEAAFGHFA